MGIVIVTGASRGIGGRIARGLAEAGHTVYAGMRDPDGPSELPSGAERIHPIRLDVTQPEEIEAAVATVEKDAGRIDALVNNAGVAWFAAAEETSEHVLRTTMETNFFGAVRATQAVLPGMRRQGSGQIIMISSLAAATGLPLESAYCASKSALEAFAGSLRHEVERFGIGVSTLEPGVTEGGLSTSTPDPEGPAVSAYQGLLDHTFAYYDEAQSDLESPQLVVDLVRQIVEGKSSGFRYRIGALAEAIEAIVRAEDLEALAIVREALGIDWWAAGKDGPSPSAS